MAEIIVSVASVNDRGTKLKKTATTTAIPVPDQPTKRTNRVGITIFEHSDGQLKTEEYLFSFEKALLTMQALRSYFDKAMPWTKQPIEKAVINPDMYERRTKEECLEDNWKDDSDWDLDLDWNDGEQRPKAGKNSKKNGGNNK